MKKIPTIYIRDAAHPSTLTDVPHRDCQWVFDGEGYPTRKYDGACCMIDASGFYKRREVREGVKAPIGFALVHHDDITGKRVGWVPVSATDPGDKWFREGLAKRAREYGEPCHGTYELCGPKVQGNPEGYAEHLLILHSEAEKLPRQAVSESITDYLRGRDIEGIVWHHPDGRMAKIKKRDFGMKRTEA